MESLSVKWNGKILLNRANFIFFFLRIFVFLLSFFEEIAHTRKNGRVKRFPDGWAHNRIDES